MQNRFNLKPGEIDPELLEGPLAIKPKVYKSYHTRASYGPIAKYHDDTLYDLLTKDDSEMRLIRASFPSWSMPRISTGYYNGTLITKLYPLVNFVAGRITTSNYRATQYLYAVVNFNLVPTSDFGSIDLQNLSHTHTIVCVNIGDPRTGSLNRAYIEYALPLNTKIKDCTELVSRELRPGVGELFFHRIVPNDEWTAKVHEKWFGAPGYLFNSGIYPRVIGFAPVNNE